MGHGKKIKVSDIQPGPVRHLVLPAALVDRIRAYKQILGDADPTSLDRAIDNFKRDANPERELEIWERIASIYQAFAYNLRQTPRRLHDLADTLPGQPASCQ